MSDQAELRQAVRFPPGEGIGQARPGDFILVRGASWRSRLIRCIERARFRRSDEQGYSHWSHAALIVGSDGTIVEAGTGGVVLQHIEKYRDVEYSYVPIRAAPTERWKAVRFAASRIGTPYGSLAIAHFAASRLTGGRIAVNQSGRDVCAGLVARALERGAETFERRASEMTPGDLARHYRVKGGTVKETPILVATLFAAAAIPAYAADGAEPSVTASCNAGVTTIKGFQARVFCGPASVSGTVNGKSFSIKNGMCERYPKYFLINVGTVVLGVGKNKPQVPYFGLIMGNSPAYSDPPVNKPGTYHKALITIDGPGINVDLHNEADLTVVLKNGLRSGTFSGTQPGSKTFNLPTYKVNGSFTC